MYPANITRAETAARASLIQTQAYDLVVNITGLDDQGQPLAEPDRHFVTTSRIRFNSGTGVTHVDVIADRIISATLDDVPIDTSEFDGTRLPIALATGTHRLVVTALHRFSRSGQGLHRFVDPADQRVYCYTQFEPADARRVFANFEQPDLKARFAVTVVAPRDWTVAANSADPIPVPVDEANSRWQFAPTPPLSTYLIAIVAGDYHRIPGTVRTVAGEVPASILCRTSLAPHVDTERIMATTQAGFEVFQEAFGAAFPFDSYDQAFVPEYNAGAMENAGLVTFRDDLIFRSRATSAQYDNRDNTILHELAHMWFGDLVTMRWWDDLWLKESFAEWASHHAQSRIGDARHAWASFSNARKTWAYRADQLPTTHPIAADMVDLEAVELNFDGITYAKGASALRQLVAFVGQDAFLAGAKKYFERHAWGNTTLPDLLTVLANASGRDLSAWSAQWLETSGVNTLSGELSVDPDGAIDEFAITQTAPEAHPTLREHRLAIGCYHLDGDRLVRTVRIETDIHGPRTPIPELTGVAQPDLLLINDDDLTYAKIRLDPVSRATAIAHIDKIDDELTRALVWGAAWDMCRDGELPVADYLDMALRGIAAETDQTAVTRILGQAHLAANLFLAPEARRAAQQDLASGLHRLVREAAPGSDHQLAFTRALAACVDKETGSALLEQWLAGSDVPDGLVIDTDLRWQLITHLARLGTIDDAAIDAELAADPTISGAEWAAGARTAQPTAAAKARAWELATTDPSIPNETYRRICLAFAHPGQEDLLVEYADRYFDLAEDIAAQRGPWAQRGVHLAQSALRYLFPAVVADKTFITHLDEWLATAELTDSARRIIAECRDDALRALRVRAANGGQSA